MWSKTVRRKQPSGLAIAAYDCGMLSIRTGARRLLPFVLLLTLALTAQITAQKIGRIRLLTSWFQDWPQFGLDVSSSGSEPAATGITAANAALLVRHQVQLDGTVDASAIFLQSVTVNGSFHDVFFVTTTYGKTIALDANSGAVLWEYVPPGFDSWAGTFDARFFLPARLEFTGAAYRGQALGGLGGGAYKDFAYSINATSGIYYFRPLDDVGGWAQLKERLSERLELNAAFGIDDAFAGELRQYAVLGGALYQNLSRNRTFTGNAIYSPSAYLQFSLEYRHLESSPVIGWPAGSNIIGLGAGYQF